MIDNKGLRHHRARRSMCKSWRYVPLLELNMAMGQGPYLRIAKSGAPVIADVSPDGARLPSSRQIGRRFRKLGEGRVGVSGELMSFSASRLPESLSIGFGSGKIADLRVAQGPHESEYRRSPGELIFPFAPTTVVDGCARPGCPFT
jgi:hypothetical protein